MIGPTLFEEASSSTPLGRDSCAVELGDDGEGNEEEDDVKGLLDVC
jgi:hypothetical protein